MGTSLDGMPGYDAWLMHNPAYDVEECDENGYHDYNRKGRCKLCGAYNEHGYGQDPDDARDAQREREWEDSQEPDYETPLFEHPGE